MKIDQIHTAEASYQQCGACTHQHVILGYSTKRAMCALMCLTASASICQLAEVFAINSIAPFVLTSKLLPLMQRSTWVGMRVDLCKHCVLYAFLFLICPLLPCLANKYIPCRIPFLQSGTLLGIRAHTNLAHTHIHPNNNFTHIYKAYLQPSNHCKQRCLPLRSECQCDGRQILSQ